MREATIHLSDESLEALGIGEFVSMVRSHGLESVSELQCERPGCLLVVRTEDPIPPARLVEQEKIEWWEQLRTGDDSTYLCKVSVPAMETELKPSPETAVAESEVSPTESGIDVRLVGDQDALSDRVADYEGVAPISLRSLGAYDGPGEPLEAVTDRQREVLAVARDIGFFDVPRAATTEEVAAELDLSPSTVREHLQRAQGNVVDAVLGSRDPSTE